VAALWCRLSLAPTRWLHATSTELSWVRALWLQQHSLSPLYEFTLTAVETLGAVGESAMDFFRQLGRRIATTTAETSSFAFLMQRLSVVIQRGNAVCVAGTSPSSGD